MNKKAQIDMINGPLLGKLILFAIPVMASSMLQLLFNAADIIVVGRFAGDESLAAVGSTGSIVNLLVGLFMGLSIGVNVVIAHFYGSGQKERISDAVHTGITMSLVCGVLMAIFGAWASGILLRWMGSPDDVIGLATLYLRIYFMAMPATLLYNFGAAMLRASGNTATPMLFLAIAGVINVILNLILVIPLHMGVAGVGIATVVSQYVSAGLVLVYLMKRNDELQFSFSKMSIQKDILLRIVQIGFPAGIQGMVFSLSNVVIQSAINSFGSTVIAGNSAAANIEGFVYMGMNAMYQTAITFVGQNYGAGKHKRILKVALQCEIIVILIGLVMGNLAYVFGDALLHLYTDSDAVVAAGIVRLKYICCVYFLCGIMDTMVGVLRGIGKSIMPMIVSILGACVLRLVWIATVFQMYRTPEMLYIAYAITWTITFIAHLISFIIFYHKIKKKSDCSTEAEKGELA